MTQARGVMVRTEDGRRVNPPLFGHVYRLKTRGEQNAKGKWQGWSIGFEGASASTARLQQDDELYQAAKGLRDMVTTGAAKAAYESAGPAANPEDSDEM